jgi:hypothetical protein|tara:strand:+ start:90501 stop:92189 length:1689 start_codon:yes stop_codon:yes gene_type:complete
MALRTFSRLALLSGSIALGLCLPTTAALAAPDTIFLNGTVFTADESGSVVQAFAVENDRFSAIGSNQEISGLADASTNIVDLEGRFVAPGLTDGHFHNEGGGDGIDLSGVETMQELLAEISEGVAQAGPDEIVITNGDWHEMQLAEQRLPIASEIDTVSPNTPVVIVRGGHSYILNTAALKRWNINRDTASPDGGQITRDADGNLTGELFDTAKALVELPPSPAASLDDLRNMQAVLNSYGITSVRIPGGASMSSDKAYRMLNELQEMDELSVRYSILLRGFGRDPEAVIRAINATGLRQGDGNDWVRIDGIKLGVDGGFEGGLVTEAYAEPYGQDGTYYGVRTVPIEKYNEIVSGLNRAGWTIATHAAGDAAVEQVLGAYEIANAEVPIQGRHFAIEHAFLTSQEQRARVRDLGLHLSVQDHLYVAAPAFRNYLGRERAEDITPLRSYLDDGLMVALGTDSPVIPVNPYWELYHYITRDTRSDGVYGADEKVADRSRLLRTMTVGYAELTGEEDRKGQIAPGMYADFVVMSDNFLTVPAEKIKAFKALATYVAGDRVYSAD